MKQFIRHLLATAKRALCLLLALQLTGAPVLAAALLTKEPPAHRLTPSESAMQARILGAAPVPAGKKTYVVCLKKPAQERSREELLTGHSPVADYIAQHHLTTLADRQFHFVNVFTINLSPAEYTEFFNREWVDTEIQDPQGKVLQRQTKPAGKALQKAEIDALFVPVKGSRTVHHFQNIMEIGEDTPIELCGTTNAVPTYGIAMMGLTNFPITQVTNLNVNVAVMTPAL